MNYNNIAVIGISGKFAQADDLEQFSEILANKKECISKIPDERLALMGFDRKNRYVDMGFMNDIDCFDHEFFGISEREAGYLSPEQRISMEMAVLAVLDAGYSISQIRGSRCSVSLATTQNIYGTMIKRHTGVSLKGNMPSMAPGRIAHFLDLRGANFIQDSGCSSALVQIHDTCMKLSSGETDLGLVGGVIVNLNIPQVDNNYNVFGLSSPTFRSRPYDADADGVALGEGAGCVMLKRLVDAERDGDHIYGVVKCGAVNGDGGRSESPSMPSIDGESEVLCEVWQHIDPSTITEIEGHGIGTTIGDTVEAASIDKSLKKCGIDSSGEVLLSSVKSNIGHLSYAAGLSSLIKVMLGLENGVTYPISNFVKQSPLIDFQHSALKPLSELKNWDKNSKRVVGINSFGLSGTNAHIIAENYRKKSNPVADPVRSLVKLSARTPYSFENYKKTILSHIEERDYPFGSLCFTMNSGRDDYSLRRMVAADDIQELSEQLEMITYSELKPLRIVFLMKHSGNDDINAADFADEFPAISRIYRKLSANGDINAKFAIYSFLTSIGIKADTVLADKTGKAVIDLVNGKLNETEMPDNEPVDNDFGKTIAYLEKLEGRTAVAVIGRGADKIKGLPRNIRVYNATEPSGLEKLIIAFYNSGGDINWDKFYDGHSYARISLPGYCFEKNHFWELDKSLSSRPVNAKTTSAEQKEPAHTEAPTKAPVPKETSFDIPVQMNTIIADPQEKNSVYLQLEHIWRRLFDFDSEIGGGEDFFDLGGNSLLIQQMSLAVNEVFGIEFDIYQIYDNPTIKELSERITQQLAEG